MNHGPVLCLLTDNKMVWDFVQSFGRIGFTDNILQNSNTFIDMPFEMQHYEITNSDEIHVLCQHSGLPSSNIPTRNKKEMLQLALHKNGSGPLRMAITTLHFCEVFLCNSGLICGVDLGLWTIQCKEKISVETLYFTSSTSFL